MRLQDLDVYFGYS